MLEVVSTSVGDAGAVFEAILLRFEQVIPDSLGSCVNMIGDDGLVRIGHFRISDLGRRGYASAAEAHAAEQLMRQAPPRPLAKSFMAEVIEAGRTVVVRDVANGPDVPHDLRAAARLLGGLGSYALATVPLVKEGRALGTISLAREKGDFSEREIALIESFARQAVVALENARLFNETKESLERQTATADVLQVISGSMADATPVFEKILDSCERLFGSGDMGLFLAQGEQLAAAAYRGKMRDEVQRIYPKALRGSVSEYVMNNGVLLHSPAVRDDQALPGYIRDMTTALGDYSLLVAPLRWNGRSIGTIDIARNPPRALSTDEQAQVQTFADQAVIAIQNARLFNETKEALERQTATGEVLQAISRLKDDLTPVDQHDSRLLPAADTRPGW